MLGWDGGWVTAGRVALGRCGLSVVQRELHWRWLRVRDQHQHKHHFNLQGLLEKNFILASFKLFLAEASHLKILNITDKVYCNDFLKPSKMYFLYKGRNVNFLVWYFSHTHHTHAQTNSHWTSLRHFIQGYWKRIIIKMKKTFCNFVIINPCLFHTYWIFIFRTKCLKQLSSSSKSMIHSKNIIIFYTTDMAPKIYSISPKRSTLIKKSVKIITFFLVCMLFQSLNKKFIKLSYK